MVVIREDHDEASVAVRVSRANEHRRVIIGVAEAVVKVEGNMYAIDMVK